MHAVTQIVVFLLWCWLADWSHANQSKAFLLGWLAAITAHAIVDKFQLGKSGELK